MKQNKLFKTTHRQWKLLYALALLFLSYIPAQAQVFCTDELVYWLEDFGTGTTPVAHPDALPATMTFQQDGILTIEGTYRVINNSQQRPEWHNSADHTANDQDGRMMVINGVAGDFFQHITNRSTGFLPGPYSASLYLMNANTPGTCAPSPLLPNIRFSLEYQDQNGNWVGLQNSPVTSNPVQQSANPTWIVLGGVFNLPPTGQFLVTNLRVTLNNLSPGGCGNDFAIDDIKLASCPGGAPVPVLFEKIQARAQGPGILVSWSTAQETNNDRFEIERSQQGNGPWELAGTVKGAGNSQVRTAYQWMDYQASPGVNFYRIKQVDWDGKFAYSATVQAKLQVESVLISVMNNPVTDYLKLQTMSEKPVGAVVRLLDASGRISHSSRLNIPLGQQDRRIQIPPALHGIYYLQIMDEEGKTLFKDKILIP